MTARRQSAERPARSRHRHREAARRVDARPTPASTAWRSAARWAPAAGPAAIAAAGSAMLAWTWRTWPDPVVDFGREVYLAWRLAGGATLYADVAHFSGPLSPYLNALWFTLFGPGILALALCNVALTAGFVALLYALLVRVADRLAATAACLVFLVLFACAQYTRIGNYNWVTPYSHELTHGVMLAVAALWCLARYQRTGGLGWVAGTGLATGLVALTKAETLLAGGLGVATGLALTLVAERPGAGRAVRLGGAFAAGLALPPAVVFCWFLGAMPVGEILAWPLGHWRVASMPALRGAGFYRATMGTDDVGANLARLASATLWYAPLLALAVGGGWGVRRAGAGARYAAAAALAGTAVLLGTALSIDAWLAALRPLPAFMAVAAGAAATGAIRARADRERAAVLALRAALAVLALALLAKIALNVRLFHYGFVLAMPATAVLVVALVHWLPAALERRGVSAAFARAVALGALLAAVPAHLGFMAGLVAAKTDVVGAGRDAFRADRRGRPIAQLVDEVRARVGPTETLAVLPEGAMVSYLTRRPNPTPYYLFDNTSLLLWGEGRMLGALEAAAPDWVAVVDRGKVTAGRWSPAGRDANPVLAWVERHYRPVWALGTPFAGQHGVAVALLRRTDAG